MYIFIDELYFLVFTYLFAYISNNNIERKRGRRSEKDFFGLT